jgi:hypothetical protein
MSNLPSKEIQGVLVEFIKIPNYNFSKAYRAYMSTMTDLSTGSAKEIIESYNHKNYEEIRDILFTGCIVKGAGHIAGRQQYEKMIDLHGINFELALYGEAVSYFLLPCLLDAADKSSIGKADNTKDQASTAPII